MRGILVINMPRSVCHCQYNACTKNSYFLKAREINRKKKTENKKQKTKKAKQLPENSKTISKDILIL